VADDAEPFEQDGEEPLFMALRTDNPDLLEATAHARATVDQFRELIATLQGDWIFHSAKLRFRDADKSQETGEDWFFYVWVDFVSVEGDEFVGKTIQAPSGAPGLESGQVHRFRDADIYDWMVNDQGRIHGGYSLRVIRKHLPEARHAAYDKYIGAESYE
jgi:uncharacterized protein YegJ (DUF2314 family)